MTTLLMSLGAYSFKMPKEEQERRKKAKADAKAQKQRNAAVNNATASVNQTQPVAVPQTVVTRSANNASTTPAKKATSVVSAATEPTMREIMSTNGSRAT